MADESERTAKVLCVKRMRHEILVEGLDDDDDDDDEEEEEDEDEDDDDIIVKLDEKEEEWWQRLKKLEIEYGPELAARDLVAKEHILDYDPKQGGRLLHLTPPCL
jgi:hypothetical protein